MNGKGTDLKRRHQAEDQAGQHRHQHCEAEDARGDADILQQRDADGVQVGQSARPRQRQHNAQNRAVAGEDHAFGQHLANQTRPSCTERRANRNLLLTRGSPRQQQV